MMNITNSLRSTWATWKNTTLSPLSPPRQKYLENVKKVKKTTKSAIFLVIYYNKVLQIFMKIADFVVFFTFFAFSRYFWRGGGGGRGRRVFPSGPCWSQTICIFPIGKVKVCPPHRFYQDDYVVKMLKIVII